MTPDQFMAFRKRQNWTQSTLGGVIKLNEATVFMLEKGKYGIKAPVAHMCGSVDLLRSVNASTRQAIFEAAPVYRELWERVLHADRQRGEVRERVKAAYARRAA